MMAPEREAMARERARWAAPHEAHDVALLRDVLRDLDELRAGARYAARVLRLMPQFRQSENAIKAWEELDRRLPVGGS